MKQIMVLVLLSALTHLRELRREAVAGDRELIEARLTSTRAHLKQLLRRSRRSSGR